MSEDNEAGGAITTPNGLSVDERKALREIHHGTLQMAVNFGQMKGEVSGLKSACQSIDRRMNTVTAAVEGTRVEVARQGQLFGTLASESAVRSGNCQKRFNKQSEELDAVRADIDEKVAKLADTTNRLHIVEATAVGEKTGRWQSWKLAAALIGWGIALGLGVVGFLF